MNDQKAVSLHSYRTQQTIGIFIDWTEDPYHQTIIKGIVDYARENRVNSIVFEGGSLDSPREYELERNLVYPLASAETLDGIIVFSASMARYINASGMKSFFSKYADLPIVSISMAVEKTPSVLIDNKAGIKDLLIHLLKDHGYRRIAFITGTRGNPDAHERYDVYEKTLTEFGITVDPRLIFQGDFTISTGVKAVRTFIDETKQDFDVIVASNDNMALGAIEELRRRGIRVPAEKAVTGFDDVDICNYSSPSISTVRQPLREVGKTAVRTLIDILDGKEVPQTNLVPTRMILRESCGCRARPFIIPESYPETDNDAADFDLLAGEREILFIQISTIVQDLFVNKSRDETEQIVFHIGNALLDAVKASDSHGFLNALDDVITSKYMANTDMAAFQTLISELKYHLFSRSLPHKTTTIIGEMCFHALLLLGNKSNQYEWSKAAELVSESQTLNFMREELLVALDITKQMEVLYRRLPQLGITSCYLSLYKRDSSSPTNKAVCMLGYNGPKQLHMGNEGTQFPAKKLVPDNFLINKKRVAVMVEGLKQLGFIVFEMGTWYGRLYAILSDIISSALHGAIIYQEVQSQRNGLSMTVENMRKAMGGFIQTMALTAESREPYTAGHQKRVSDLARTIAQEMKLPLNQIEAIRMAGIIHDLGKIYVPVEILNRPGPLDELEYGILKKHPTIGYEIIKGIEFPWPIADIIRQHHERLDGSGYPNALRGDEISLEARIIAVADVVEAMISHRPYRESHNIERVIEELKSKRGILFDETVVDACVTLLKDKGYNFKQASGI